MIRKIINDGMLEHVLTSFRKGLDTQQIAQALCEPEYDVEIVLHHGLEQDRQRRLAAKKEKRNADGKSASDNR